MSEDYRELLIGCGRDRKKRYCAEPTHPRSWRNPKGPTTLDINFDVKPDLWCDLNGHPPWTALSRGIVPVDPAAGNEASERHYYIGEVPRVLLNDYWDEIHAYQVLEHLGQQGDAHALLSQFAELWRILKPGGYLVAEVPSRFSPWLWGDPSHRRAIVPETLVFLDQSEYIRQCDSATPSAMSDFRNIYKADFRCTQQHDNRMDFAFVLQAVKPSRCAGPYIHRGTGKVCTCSGLRVDAWCPVHGEHK